MIKTIKTKLSLLFCIVTSLLFVLAEQACVHKEDKGTTGTPWEECTPTRDSLLQWYRFKTGTYWVYEDASTGILDSCRVNLHLDTIYANGLWEFKVGVTSYLDSTLIYYNFQSTDILSSLTSPTCEIMPIWAETIIPNIDECRQFFYPMNVTEHLYHTVYRDGHYIDGATSIDAKFAHYPVGGELYRNVVRFRVTGDLLNEGRTTIYDFAKNIGIIHKSQLMADSTWRDWNLVRYTILQ